MREDKLEAALLEAHRAGDVQALVQLYTEAGTLSEANRATTRAYFFLTHAWIFALEAGDPVADKLKARLVAHGREVDT